jgi:hypothetical protein
MEWSVYGSDIREGSYYEDAFRMRLRFMQACGCVPLHLTGNYIDDFEIQPADDKLCVKYTINPDFETRSFWCTAVEVAMFELMDGEEWSTQRDF